MFRSVEENRSGCFGTRKSGGRRIGRGHGRTPAQSAGVRRCQRQQTGGTEYSGDGSRRDGGVDSGIDLRRHKLGPEDLGSALADLRLEIQREERMKDIEGQEGCQQEALDGIGIVLIDMVDMPAVGLFVEAVIFDIPSLVAEGNGPTGGDEMDRKGGYPDPVADE